MKTTGMFRRMDKTGRIVIPGEIRRSLGIKGAYEEIVAEIVKKGNGTGRSGG